MAEAVALELSGGLRVAWDDVSQVRTELAGAEPAASWRLDGALGQGHRALRVLTGATDAGAVLLVAAARPEGAEGHDSDEPQALLVSATGEVTQMDESLISTQYDAAGKVERVGLELYAEGDDYPLRGAGDASASDAADEEGLRRERIILDFRLDGEAGTAILEIVSV